MNTRVYLALFLSLSSLGTLTADETDVRSLAEFGDISSAAAAEVALRKGIAELMKRGGGVIEIPVNAPEKMKVYNSSQVSNEGPGVTILDYRGGFITKHVPSIGKHKTGVWGGTRTQRVLNLGTRNSSLPVQGVYSSHSNQNYNISGSSSYMATLTKPVKKGQDARVYVDLIRGIWVNQTINITGTVMGYGQPFESVTVKSIRWDENEKRNYFTADFDHDHPAGAFVYQKHVVNSAQIEGFSNADNQSMELQVIRHQYGVGDSFAVGAQLKYMSDIFSGFGDEGAIVINSETIGDLKSFHSRVESVDWSKDGIIFAGGKSNPHTLAPSRPLINLNQDKWLTKGKVRIVTEYHAYKGKTYPHKQGGFNNSHTYRGGAILGSADCGWTEEIVGRFFAVTDESEVITPDDKSSAGGYAELPDRITRRWYRIMDFTKNSDGTFRIKILRVFWSATPAGSPYLFVPDNYTFDGHDRPLSYAIAPGAWVYDISKGWADTNNTGGFIEDKDHPRTLKVVATGDRGTRFDFAPGDEVEQAVGPDPWHPTPLRIRQFDQMPSTMNGASISVLQEGRVQVPHGIIFEGITQRREDLKKRKDRKPSFGTIMRLQSLSDIGIDFNSEVISAAIFFRQPGGHPQPILWNSSAGTKRFYVIPAGDGAGNFRFEGGNLDINYHGVVKTKGISSTEKPANNLRGIRVEVPPQAKSVRVKFPVPEADDRYAITVQCNWLTMDAVNDVDGSGFTVKFSEPAPTEAWLNWHLIR